jgi:iron complex outermembrane receptor protein
MMNCRMNRVLSAFMVSVSTIAVPAVAQEAATADTGSQAPATASAPSGAAPEAGGLEAIVVTARRQQENLQNIPVAANVVSAAQVDRLRITSIERISSLAPQLIIGRSGTGNGGSLALRGISVNATSISLEQSVATVVDGVYYSGGRALNMGLFDVGQIEVLKGPQSLFYGKNTTAGAISVTTASPTTDFEAMMRAGYEFKAQQPYAEAYISGPLSDTLSARVAARYSRQYGALIENTAYPVTTYTRDIATGTVTPHYTPAGDPDLPGEKSAIVRGSLKFDPGNGFEALLKTTYNYYHTSAANSSSVVGVCESGQVQTDPTAPCGHVFKVANGAIPKDIAQFNPWQNRHGGTNYLDYYMFNATLDLNYTGDNFTVSVVPAYTTYKDYWVTDSDFTSQYLQRASALGTGGNNAATREQQNAFSVEARARTKFSGMFNFMVGGYYQHSKLEFGQENLFPGGVENSAVSDQSLRYLTLRKRGLSTGDTYSVFGQALVDITPTLNLAGGLRYSHEDKQSVLAQPYVVPSPAGASFAQTSIGADQSFNNTSPEATITWKPTPQLTVFGSYRTGYKSGGFSISGTISRATTADNAAFGPERVKGFEAGIKSTLLDNQLRLNADVFRYVYTGLQVDFFDPLTIQYLTVNAAKARTQGVELDVEFAPRSMPGLNIKASGAYTDAIYTSFPNAPCVSGQRPLEGCNLAVGASGAFTRQDLGDQRMPQAPKITATFNVDYETAVGGGLKLGLSGSMRYSSRYKTYGFAPDNADRFFQSSYATVDAAIRLAREDDSWELAVIGKNLTNHFIQAGAFDLTYTGGGTGLATGRHADVRSSIYDPRTAAVQFTYKFN